MNHPRRKLIEEAYEAFNNRNVEAVLNVLDTDVCWANGWEGGYINGHHEVKAYWERQWQKINPTVVPISYEELEDGRLVVEVHQQVKDLRGKALFDGVVYHVYTFKQDKISTMEIKKREKID